MLLLCFGKQTRHGGLYCFQQDYAAGCLSWTIYVFLKNLRERERGCECIVFVCEFKVSANLSRFATHMWGQKKKINK